MNIQTRPLPCLLILMLLTALGCQDIPDPDKQDENPSEAITYGSARFEFPLTDKYGAGTCTRRMDLSISYTADSLYRKEYITAANLSDFQGFYTFQLRPGKYYYQAGKVCTCLGDTCLWNGYPGGRMGVYWTMGWIEVEEGKTWTELIVFKK